MSEIDPCQLYLLSPPQIESAEDFAVTLDSVFSSGDVACFQLRLKEASEDHLIQVANAIRPVCISHDVAFILNDSAELAKQVDADGVHLGQSDGSVEEARTLLGYDKSIGVTCHDSRHLAFEAGDKGADYVAFGTFFDSPTKASDYRPELDILTGWDEATEIPSVAIGGITVDNCQQLAKAGAHFVAVSSGVWSYPEGPEAAVKAFNAQLKADL
ncbi:thiamine phosphate synthase [Temperatibacter marinus]|uniref:Thiamine-phosphate synthase n=1 Tax=Temperatibacter marinus TaxID=1456591 RepID=A0AA52EF59_9PROT|nr:thiamine phosphate synthase [Temperatibacter marinus]WND01414.1 thiamine phosphate synthase [Temperatibacter marinus]